MPKSALKRHHGKNSIASDPCPLLWPLPSHLDGPLVPLGDLSHQLGGKVDVPLLPDEGACQQLFRGEVLRKTKMGPTGEWGGGGEGG